MINFLDMVCVYVCVCRGGGGKGCYISITEARNWVRSSDNQEIFKEQKEEATGM